MDCQSDKPNFCIGHSSLFGHNHGIIIINGTVSSESDARADSGRVSWGQTMRSTMMSREATDKRASLANNTARQKSAGALSSDNAAKHRHGLTQP
eukprot:6436204-Amphidinium_carterae.1